MDQRRRAVVAAGATTVLFSLVGIGALALVTPFAEAGLRPPSDPSNPATGVLYFVGILLATGLMLAAIKLGVQGLIRALVLGTSGLLTWIVGTVLLGQYLPSLPGAWIAAAFAVCLVALLYVYPEWYVIDAAGVVMGAGAAGLFGISFGVLPAIILLVILALYDAISVYGTEHMLTLADNAMELRIPVLFVVPTSLSYSFLPPDDHPPGDGPPDGDPRSGDSPEGDPDPGGDGTDPSGELPEPDEDGADGGVPDADATDGGDATGPDGGPAPEVTGSDETPGSDDLTGPEVTRDALFVGLGDAVMPTILAVSAAFYVDAPHYDLPVLLNAPALGALVGTLLGLSALQVLVFRGRAHAGLPLLNGGAISGYLVGATLAGVGLAEALGIAGYL